MAEKEFTVDNYTFKILGKDQVGLLEYHGTREIQTIPSKITDRRGNIYKITHILKNSFKDANIITLEFASDSFLEKIENRSFMSSKISKVVLPASFKFYSDKSFIITKDSQVPSIEVDKKNRFLLEDHGIIYCKAKPEIVLFPPKVKRFTIRESLTYINSYACFRNLLIKYICIPDSVRSIGARAFRECLNLERVYIGEDSQLEIIQQNAFFGVRIESIRLPKKLKIICDNAFDCCKKLRHIVFATGICLESIGEYAFTGSKARVINFPASLQSIGEGAFGFQFLLEHITFPMDSKLRNIAKDAFEESPKICKIECHDDLYQILENDLVLKSVIQGADE